MSDGSFGRNALIGVAAVAVGALAWGTLVERRAYTLRETAVELLPPGSSPLRILHISDIHLAPWQEDKIHWIHSLAELYPDLIINTGDNLGHLNSLPALTEAFAPFEGTPGVFVHGSNDYFAPEFKNPFAYFSGPSKSKTEATRLDTQALTSFFTENLGWANLNNAAAVMTLGDSTISFMGVDDPHRHFDSLTDMERSVEALAQENVFDEERTTVTIGVTHAPYQRILNEFVSLGADAIFAGHTHGGQVCVPGFGALVTNCDIPREQVKGVSTWTYGQQQALLNVSAGVGTSIYAPVRFACKPEASLITLMPRLGA